MNKMLLFTLLLLTMLPARGQPLVNFKNFIPGGERAPVYGVDPRFPFIQFRGGSGIFGGPPLDGSGNTAELWGGPLGSTEDSLVPLGATTFRTGAAAGFLVEVQVPVLAVPSGERATFQVRAWENLGGTVTSWHEASSGDFGAYGSSALFSPPDALGTNPLNLVGLTSFNLVAPKSLTNAPGDCVPTGRSSIAWFDGPASGFPLDVDRDGTPDVNFWAELGQCTADFPISACYTPFYAAGVGTNAMLGDNNGVWIRPAGFSVGSVTASNVLWSAGGQRLPLTHFFSSPRYGTSGWTTPLGRWRAGYLGVRFRASDGWHYGWIHIRLPGEGESTPVVTDWAYETRPDVAICTGAKPVIVPMAPPQVVRPGQLRLRWMSEVGKAYQVQFKDRVDAPRWTNLEFVLIATASESAVDVPLVGAERFLRVVEAD